MNSSNSLDLFVTSSLDQTNEINASWVIERMDEVIRESISKRNVDIAVNILNQLLTISKLSGLGLAKGLYELSTNWEIFGIDEPFTDYIYQRIGKHKATVERYIKVWKMFAKEMIPTEYTQQIMSINIISQIPIANTLDQGWQLDNDDWKKLAYAPDGATINKILHEIKNEPERSNSLRLEVDRGGNIWVYPGKDERKFVGTLELDSEYDCVKKAVKRITSRSGIMER